MFLKKMKDPAFWEKVRTDKTYAPTLAAMKELYEKECNDPIVELPYTVAADFAVSGDRVTGEAYYFKRRRMLSLAAVLAMVYPEETAYFDKMQDYIFAVCNEYTWEIPAHIPNMVDYIPDDIDLFAAETGYCLSEIYAILEDRLSPLIKTRIKMEVERRIILPFSNYDRKFAWLGFRSNWASVCAGSVAAAFMYLFPERFYEVKPRIDQAIQNFLASYRESGYCYEGIAYWEYGFGFFVTYAQMLYDFTGGKENLFDSEKVKAIATFPQKAFLSGSALVSFSDGMTEGVLSRGLCHFLAHQYPEDVIPVPQPDFSPIGYGGRWNLGIRGLAWFDPATEKISETLTDYSLDAEWLIYRTLKFGFAAKGGTNWEAHNHNDVASFIFATGGKQVFADIGAGEYTRQYFQEEHRYNYFNPSSRSHSVPILFGNYQKTGGTHRAKNTVYDGKTMTFDFASAYDIPQVTALNRTFAPDKSGVTVTDEITYAEGVTPKTGDFTERFALLCKPEIQGNVLTAGGVIATFTGAEAPSVSVETVGRHNNLGDPYPVYLVDFPVTGTKFTLRIEPNAK